MSTNQPVVIVADQIEMVPIEDLRCGRNRVKVHSADQIAQLAGMMVEFGWTVPILIDNHNEIVAGRGRWLAGKQVGVTHCPCVRTTHLSHEQVRALIIADNKISESPWDLPELKIEMGALKEFDEALLGLTGFDFEEIDEILEGALTDETSDKDAEEIPKVHFLNVGKHKVEMTVDEHNDLVELFSAWSKHHQGYRGLVQHILDAVRNYSTVQR
jgi:ParB-like chromosome segregation protein Spo0J